ncbi:MAG: hypothetical protein ACYTGH_09185 [Planctomycetota bacterium]|jgi:hypothetical protein
MSSQSIEPGKAMESRGGGELPRPATDPLVESAPADEAEVELPADVLSQLDEEVEAEEAEEALSELQELLVGQERDDIQRLEGAVSGFIRTMINEEHLSTMVGAMVKEAVARQVVALHDEMGEEAGRLVVSAFRRELAIKKADMPEMVAPFLGHAVSDAIERSQDRMRSEVAKSIRGILAREVSVQRGELPEQLRQVVKNTVSAVARQVLTEMRPEAESMVAVAVEKEIAVHRGELAERIQPYVEDAVAQEVRLCGNRITRELEPVLDERIAHLLEIGRKRLGDTMTEALLPQVRQHLLANQERLVPFVQDTVEELVQDGIRTEVGRSMTDYTREVRQETRAAHRNHQLIIGLVLAIGVLAGSLYLLFSGFSERLQKANDRILKLEGALEYQGTAGIEDMPSRSPRRLRTTHLD